MYGGAGTAVGAIIGALFMGVLNNGMSILGYNTDVQSILKGFVLLLAVAVDIFSKSRSQSAGLPLGMKRLKLPKIGSSAGKQT